MSVLSEIVRDSEGRKEMACPWCGKAVGYDDYVSTVVVHTHKCERR